MPTCLVGRRSPRAGGTTTARAPGTSRAGAAYAGDPDEVARVLAGAVRPGDVVAVMGAGDIRRAGERLLALLGGATA